MISRAVRHRSSSRASRRRRCLAAGALGLLASCTVGPDFTPPGEPKTGGYTREGDDKLPAAGANEVAQHVEVGKKIAGNWWAAFHSRVLNELLERALANNRTLAAAKATLAQSQQAVLQAAGAYYPSVGFKASASRQRASLASEGLKSLPAEFNLYSVGPSASFDLDLFGGNRRRVEQQAAFAEAQEYQLDAAYLTLTGNVATQVVGLAATRAEIKAVEEIIANDERTLQSVRIETSAGQMTRVDIDSAENELAADRTLLPPLQQQLNVTIDALALLLGRAPADWTPPGIDLGDLSLPEQLPLELPSKLVHERPDMLTAEAQLHAASAAIGVATAQMYPNITLTASIGQEALSPAHLFAPASNIWSIASGLTAPIFQGGALEAQKRGTESAFDAALATYEQTVLQSFSQVADVLHALAHDAELVREERKALAVAAASLEHVRTMLSYGGASLLQVLDAERQFARARIGLTRSEAQRYRDTIQLFVAMGGGWREWRAHAPTRDVSGAKPEPVATTAR